MTAAVSSTSTTTPKKREEEVLVLYGSQTGNSEQAATELSSQMRTKLTPLIANYLKDNNSNNNNNNNNSDSGDSSIISVIPKLMQLDDFLEFEKAKWTRLVVIVVSSYGIGQAPLGARRFREFIDHLIETYSEKTTTTTTEADATNLETSPRLPPLPQRRRLLLEGITFALCGLGDSKYPTFFQNPTAVWRGLQAAGAIHVGPLGKADASSGRDIEVIAEWRDGIWPFLAQVIVQDPPANMEATLAQMQKDTLEICHRLNPDMKKLQQERQKQQQLSASLPLWTLVSAVTVALLAIVTLYVKN